MNIPESIQTTFSRTALSAQQLSHLLDVQHLPASTKRLKSAPAFLGQARAEHALTLAMSLSYSGYHVCAIGSRGLGKRYHIQQFLAQQSSWALPCFDWLYVHNFRQVNRPILFQCQSSSAPIIVHAFEQAWSALIQRYFTDFVHQTAHDSLSPSDLTAFIDEQFKIIDDVEQYISTHQKSLFQHYVDDYKKHLQSQFLSIIQPFSAEFIAHQLPFWHILPAPFHLQPLSHATTEKTAFPVVYEHYPTVERLFGEIKAISCQDSAQYTVDSIYFGALHRANGGVLLLDLDTLLQHPHVWQMLKHALKMKQWDWNTLPHSRQITLQPDSIPLNLKVILLADAEQYDELLAVDAELAQLFKIRADFNDTLPRTAEHELAYVQWIASIVQQQQLLPLNRQALACILNESSRVAENQNALSLHAGYLKDLLRESHYYAQQQQAEIIDKRHVETALQQHLYRLGYWRDLYWQDITQGTQLIETQGYRLGQVNALSVIQYSDSEFGFPSRLTASVSQGAGDILDIERSVELGGSLHAKGTLLMSSFLKSHFGRQQSLNFSAAIAFEQSYGEVDGDSATVAELSALISAISQIPINQAWAITGSMNQLGQVQPVGGINAKIEGFFDACQLQGLTGEQGVIIPRQNTQHLMLRSDIIQAVTEQRFHIHAIDTIEQALELLMARPIGQADKKGYYPTGSIYEAVIVQLEQWHAIDSDVLLEDKPKKHKKKKS